MSTTPKRGVKVAPKSKPGKWDRPEREASCTKKGPGRKAKASASSASRTAVAPESRKKLIANIGGSDLGGSIPFKAGRRIWREGEPIHIVKPVRAARRALEAKREQEAA